MIQPLRLLAAVVLAALSVTACGFQPMYGGARFAQLPGLDIQRGDSRVDYLVEDSLRDFLGAGRSPYTLTLDNTPVQRSLGLSATGIARQYALEITTDYQLLSADGAVLAQGRIREEALFDAGSDPYSLIAGQSAAEAQASEAVAERLVRELAIALRQIEAGAAR